ncbi:60S ribosomal protein [Musa troglodytarum]|uniref:60S ribosomal protein n=1 Tax=Musa troglodytarum TaxID=320322 RepID=A0A9E7EMX5_9LILI|nr:60S ribosomal protein [Musa troglodytarum]
MRIQPARACIRHIHALFYLAALFLPSVTEQREEDKSTLQIRQRYPTILICILRPAMDLEFDEDLMVLDDVPANEARWKLANEDREKGDHCANATGVDIFAVENPSTPAEMVQDSSHVEAVRKCKPEVKDEQKRVKKLLKRKRACFDGNVNCDNKEVLITKCQGELDELFEYHMEVSGLRLQLDDGAYHSNNMMVAYLLEESRLPFSKLVGEIYGALKGKNGITLASVRGTVLFVGQRMMYGISSADADVLEDESESSLWCWETRDIKLLPITLRGVINIRRMARKKIHERISALSVMLSALSSPEHKAYGNNLMEASIKLGKALNKQGISSFVENLTQKYCADMAEKGARLQQKELMKEIEKSKQSAEKEKKKMDREFQKEKLRREKELNGCRKKLKEKRSSVKRSNRTEETNKKAARRSCEEQRAP